MAGLSSANLAHQQAARRFKRAALASHGISNDPRQTPARAAWAIACSPRKAPFEYRNQSTAQPCLTSQEFTLCPSALKQSATTRRYLSLPWATQRMVKSTGEMHDLATPPLWYQFKDPQDVIAKVYKFLTGMQFFENLDAFADHAINLNETEASGQIH
ncbi:hypothetical protein [Rhizobium laguerreae]|uniref:hypothetical protein n=1 Tax=Rhizobium laguerreae TaxID=1076926 RepID=UPI00406BA9CD